MKKLIKKLFEWVFAAELKELRKEKNKAKKQSATIQRILDGMDVSVDVSHNAHYYSASWAVVSIQGKPDYIKFMNLGNSDARHIASFLRQFEKARNIKIDADPHTSGFIKAEIRRH